MISHPQDYYEQIKLHYIYKLISFWVIEDNNWKHRFIKQRIIRKFWPEIAETLDYICKYFQMPMYPSDSVGGD